MDTTKQIINAVAFIFQKNENDIRLNDKRENIENWDSISHLHLVMHLEEIFNIHLNTEDVIRLNSIEKCVAIVEKLLQEKNKKS